MIKGLATPPEADVQYYNVVCPLGHRVRGQRTEGYQALRCPACGEGVFVLPISPLPDPGPRVDVASGRRSVEPTGVARVVEEGPIELHDPGEATVEMADSIPHPDAEISWEDDVAPSRTTERPAGPAPAPRRPAKGRPPGRDAAPVERERETTPRGGGRRADVRQPVVAIETRSRRRSGWKPVWVFALVAMVVIGTVSLRVWRTRRQELPRVAELGRVEGIPALEAGDFDRAYQILAPAKQAVDSLGGEVEGADRIRQAADEAGLYVNLATAGLEELLDQAARSDPKKWATQFDDQYRGRGVLFDTRIKAAPDSAEKRYEIDYVVLPTEDAGSFRAGGARPERSARVDFQDFELFELAQPKVGDHVVFGARLAAVEFDSGSNAWVVRLEPKSGLFVQFHKALQALGWPEADESAAPVEAGGEK
ncbi:hypothetical protein [Paludisphaera mucosa]|uniref:DUF4178 domain-containing protein n=1 Tax=Paludisphaera mucosa TaxID=3030827 RepID=A0ABT6F5U8_9BACT|nr:hypothetical protein [Paludisphaera mucosa]MDG3002934.1 hypothetical protein [Paludisphaera mucosa]